MKALNKIALSMLMSLLGFSLLWAHEHQMPPRPPSSKEFDQLKPLVGKWSGTVTHPGQQAQPPETVATEFKLTAAGSAIEETLMTGTPHEMVDMYADESGKLAMIHYCALGNQPHMVLKQADPTQIVLEMGPTVGIDAATDQHMHALTLEFPDANHLTERWTSYEGGKPGETVVFTMARNLNKPQGK
jgi:hypothetical protein